MPDLSPMDVDTEPARGLVPCLVLVVPAYHHTFEGPVVTTSNKCQ